MVFLCWEWFLRFGEYSMGGERLVYGLKRRKRKDWNLFLIVNVFWFLGSDGVNIVVEWRVLVKRYCGFEKWEIVF